MFFCFSNKTQCLAPPRRRACVRACRDVLELVLEQDAGAIAAVDVAHGATPLHWAALRGDWGAAYLLLAKRADVLVGGSRAGFWILLYLC